MATETLLALDDVVSGYGRMTILHGASMEVRARRITTIIGPNVLGNMWRSIIRVLPAPVALAASTYGISLMLSAWDLIIRIPRLLKMTTIATIRLVKPGSNIAISVRANNRDGMNVIISTKRCNIRSYFPPK